MSNNFSAATGLMVTVDPLTWADLSGDGARAFVADTPIGRFVFGTDNLGQAYHQDPDGGEDHPTEAAARWRAEAVHGMMLTERVGALGVTVAGVNAYGGTADAEPREGEAVAYTVVRDDVYTMIRHAFFRGGAWWKEYGGHPDADVMLSNSAARHADAATLAHPPAASSAARVAELETALRGVLSLDVARKEFGYLDKGIGTATTAGKSWLAARSALSAAAPEPKS